MSVYEVQRTDDVKPGEFVSALVVAKGAARARGLVAHLEGVTPKNVKATKIQTVHTDKLLSAYWDERETGDHWATEELF